MVEEDGGEKQIRCGVGNERMERWPRPEARRSEENASRTGKRQREGGMAHLGSEESVGEVNLSSKCADGSESWDDATVFDQ